MTEKQVVLKWLDYFHKSNLLSLLALYDTNALFQMIPAVPAMGKKQIEKLLAGELSVKTMVYHPTRLLQDNDWVILEYRDPFAISGCCLFQIEQNHILCHKIYRDSATFSEKHL